MLPNTEKKCLIIIRHDGIQSHRSARIVEFFWEIAQALFKEKKILPKEKNTLLKKRRDF